MVLGCLKGTVHAGYPDDKERICGSAYDGANADTDWQLYCPLTRPEGEEYKKNVRRKNQQELLAKLAFVENDNIFIETITRSLISEISIS